MSEIPGSTLMPIDQPDPGGRSFDARHGPSQQQPDAVLPSALTQVYALAVTTGLAQDTTLTLPHQPTTVHADVLQVLSGHGPCLTACKTRRPTQVTDVATDRRWPTWAAAAAAAGVSSVLAVPFDTPSAVGSLNLWSRQFRTYDCGDLRTAADLAALAGALLDSAYREMNLQRAVDGRTVIGQAQGILMERYRLTPAAAFTALAARSQALNRKLRELAEELVTTGELPQPVPRPAPPSGGAGQALPRRSR